MQEELRNIQKMLDAMLYDNTSQGKCEKANRKLEQRDKELLLDRVLKLETADEVSMDMINQGFDVVADILKKIGYNQCKEPIVQKGRTIGAINHAVMPLLIRQTLFYLCYVGQCKDVKKNWDLYMVARMKDKGVNISKNLFNNCWYTPSYYRSYKDSKVVENPCKYKGQKKDELAVAIKELVYQAGKYRNVMDLFGGSASAISAVVKRKRCYYYYNEKNRMVYNCIKVLCSNKYLDLINKIQDVQYDIYSADCKHFPRLGFDHEKEIKRYLKQMPQDTDARWKERKIFEEKRVLLKYRVNNSDIRKMRTNFGTIRNNRDYSISNVINLGDCKVFPLLEKKGGISPEFAKNGIANRVKQILLTKPFHYAEEILYLLCEQKFQIMSMRGMRMQYQGENVEGDYGKYFGWRDGLYNYKSFAYFCYFYNLHKDKKKSPISDKESVTYALAEIYLQYMSIRGSIISSEIIGEKGSVYRFIKEDFTNKITAFHETVRRVECINGDYKDAMKKCQGETIYYVDPPYVATSDYKDGANGVNGNINMSDLIRALLNSGNKFIYSMRACVTSDKEDSEYNEKNGLRNVEIDRYVYKEFEKADTPLYVLVICKKGRELAELISISAVVEVMIVNFPIKEFTPQNDAGKNSYKYRVYPFREFLRIVRGCWGKKV